jgi:hypothetical protein
MFQQIYKKSVDLPQFNQSRNLFHQLADRERIGESPIQPPRFESLSIQNDGKKNWQNTIKSSELIQMRFLVFKIHKTL